MTEEWAPVREFPDHYEVSTLGRLRRINAYRPSQAGKIRKPQIARNGYVMYMLSVANKVSLRSAHRMVADAFLGPIPAGMQVNHKNGDKADPRLENLEIVTNGENRAHSYRALGVAPNAWAAGVNNVNARLTFDEVCAIRKLFASGDARKVDLARQFKTSIPTISRIVSNRVRRFA